MSLARIATFLLILAYPALIYFGLMVLEPRALGGLLLALLFMKHKRDVLHFFRDTPITERVMLLALVLLSIAIVAANSELLLRLYPAVMSFGLLAVFMHSLVKPPSMVERIARLTEPDLPPDGVVYTRRVTQVWCVFMSINGCIALATVFGSRELWALWNGAISYMLMGALFAGEWLVRHHVRSRQPTA